MSQPFAPGVGHAIAVEDFTPNLRSVVTSFERQVRLRPNAVALEVNDQAFTYAELNSRSNQFALRLKNQDLGCSDVVAICLKRTENLLVGILAVLKVGAAYLPLNPDDPPLRLGQIVAHAGARFTVTDDASSANLLETHSHILMIDQDKEPIAGEYDGSRGISAGAADLAYVIYTSGTTGVPKGVAVTQGALSNVVNDVAQRIGFTDKGAWLAVTTVCFDIAALELLLPLCLGGKVILVSEEHVRIGRILVGILHRKKPTIMQATPITWRILIESGWSGSEDLTILCGGDRLDRDLANKLLARSSAVWNMYGPTETTIWSTAEKLSLSEEVVTLGTPLANTEVYILDHESGLPVDDGVVGEICIAGAGLARGYVNDAHLTSRYFIQAYVGGTETVRLYRTGDLGRWTQQGKLEFFGRMDHQVKINGFRVELAEIENRLQAFPRVAEAAVIGVKGASGQKRLYAMVVARTGEEVTKTALVAHLAQNLPKYMIPEKFWSLSRLPSTPHGKRDVAALEAVTRVESDLAI